jgi:SAM-dependent methyltransferase
VSEMHTFWEQRYGEAERIWSGRVNPRLPEVAAGLAPGRALDLGCGEGADARWLAERGWHVVAVDISETALRRAADDAAAAGVSERIDFQRHDLSQSFPDGDFDLVSAQFLHSPVHLDRDTLLRRAAAAVRRGGVLLIVDHGTAPPSAQARGHRHDLPSPQEVLDGLRPDPAEWVRERFDTVDRDVTMPDGDVVTIVDNVIALRRRHAAS